MNKYDTLNDMQRQAVRRTEGPLLILAGAGSGKTRVLTHRIAYLIEEKGVNPWNILAITFTNKAAGEMRERVDRLVETGSEGVWVSTFHSACVRILRRYIDRIGYDTRFTIYDADDQKSAMKQVLKRLSMDPKMYSEKSVLNAISRAKDGLITPERYAMEAAGNFRKMKIADAYEDYQRALKQSGALDFDDLIMKTVELLRADEEVRAYYQERFRYIMVDEYQDTNYAQFVLISLFSGKYKNICVVGDDDQSIYKFRGADISNILKFEETFENASVIKLEQNYRSTKTILDAANAVVKNNEGRKDKTLWCDNSKGQAITVYEAEDAAEEGKTVVRDIKKAVRNGAGYCDCACLYRTNAQSRALEEQLLFAGIPYKIIGGQNFYQRKEIKDLLAYLKTVDNGADDVAVRRVINVPRRGIGASTLAKVQLFADENNMTFYDALNDPECRNLTGRMSLKLNAFADMIEDFRRAAKDESVRTLAERILDETGYRAELIAENTDEAGERLDNLDELISKISEYEKTADEPSLGGFLDEVALVADIDNLDNDRDYVALMTVHSAKGLEFPHVFLCGMEDGLFPGYQSIVSDDPAELEEERRLCYVAITRAMKTLTVTWARKRTVRGETQRNARSRFLDEIPPLLVNYVTLSGGGRYGTRPGALSGDGLYGRRYGTPGSVMRSKPYAYSNPESGQFRGDRFAPGGSDLRKFASHSPDTGGFTSDGSYSSGPSRGGLASGNSGSRRFPRGGSSSENSGSGSTASGGSFANRTPAYATPSGRPAFGREFTVQRLTRLDYAEGDRVRHVKFGDGEVVKIDDIGRDFEVTVNFDSLGIRKMLASFARLEKI